MPRDGTATRERILATAEQLVIENGFSATSVDQVISASESSKGAFFHHFASKQALAQSLVERYVAADVAHLERSLAQARTSTDDPVDQLVQLLSGFADEADELMAEQSSCLYVAVLSERQLATSGTADLIVTAIEAWRTALSAMIRDAVAAVDDGWQIDAEALADHVFVTFEGSFLLCRSTGEDGHMRRQLTALRQLVQALLGRGA